jgi:hypothetical protein
MNTAIKQIGNVINKYIYKYLFLHEFVSLNPNLKGVGFLKIDCTPKFYKGWFE